MRRVHVVCAGLCEEIGGRLGRTKVLLKVESFITIAQEQDEVAMVKFGVHHGGRTEWALRRE